jgi:hypothetical protein
MSFRTGDTNDGPTGDTDDGLTGDTDDGPTGDTDDDPTGLRRTCQINYDNREENLLVFNSLQAKLQ